MIRVRTPDGFLLRVYRPTDVENSCCLDVDITSFNSTSDIICLREHKYGGRDQSSNESHETGYAVGQDSDDEVPIDTLLFEPSYRSAHA